MCRNTWNCPSRSHCPCPEGLTGMLVFAIFAAVLGMFQFGYNSGVLNSPKDVIQNFMAEVYKTRHGTFLSVELSNLLFAIVVSSFPVGGMLGGFCGGSVADWCGRKCGLLLNNAVAILGATLMSSSQLLGSWECLILGRFVIGINCGLNTALVPMYLSEIAPMALRGALGTVSQLGVTVGLLFAFILSVPVILGTKDGWPFLLGVAFIPAVLQLLLLPFCPESPRYLLITKGRVSEAKAAMQRFRCVDDVDDDMEDMRAEDRQQRLAAGSRISMCRLFIDRNLKMPLLIAIVMQLSQQLSGINAIFNYSTPVFEKAGISKSVAGYASIGVGVVMVIMTLVSIPMMDKLGRRTLMLYGLGGMFITSIFLTISLLVTFIYHGMTYVSVISALGFVVFFAMGPGSIPWLITAELFSQGPRPAAMSIAVLVNWSTNFFVALGFPLMQTEFENYSFLPFTCFIAIFWTFTYHKVPETKNRTFDEIRRLFRRDDPVIDSVDSMDHSIPPGVLVKTPTDSQYDDKMLESSKVAQAKTN